MKICVCGNKIPKSIIVEGKRRNLQNRILCLECLPFGKSKYRQKTVSEIKSINALKWRRYYESYKSKNGTDPIREHREHRKILLIQALGGGCMVCGYNTTYRNLAFHHLHNKQFSLCSRSLQYSMDKICAEVKKCILVCHNCHGEIHEGLINENIVNTLHTKAVSLLEEFKQTPEFKKLTTIKAQ